MPTPHRGPLIRRQSAWTRISHWTWAVALFFLLLSGLQIFNAHPTLYIGEQSGFDFDNTVAEIGAERGEDGLTGYTEVFGTRFDTTGLLGATGPEGSRTARAFPPEVTIPSGRSLASGRIVHFFFAWLLVGTLAVWAIASLVNGHLRRDLLPTMADVQSLPRDVVDHLRFRFHHGRSYGALQKLAYAGVLFVAFPLMVATGLAMSPGINAAVPWLTDVLGGRQTARTIHFVTMLALVAFFVVHITMVLAAGPFNQIRSMVTGRYRIDPEPEERT